jgi:hypothetical protein
MMNCSLLAVCPTFPLTDLEIHPFDRLVKDKGMRRMQRRSPATYLTELLRLGGYLACASDALLGNRVV